MAALGVVEMVDENMANAARVHAIEIGKGYEGRAIIAFGGGGPVHGYRVAEKIGVNRLLVPCGAGVGSAIGFLRAPVAYEVVQSLYQRFGSFDLEAVNALLAAMSAEASEVVAHGAFGAPSDGAPPGLHALCRPGARDRGAAAGARADARTTWPAIRAAYDAEYTRFYDRPVPGQRCRDPVLRRHGGDGDRGGEAGRRGAGCAVAAARSAHQAVRDTATGEVADWAVYDRDTWRPGAGSPGRASSRKPRPPRWSGPGGGAAWTGSGTSN